MVSMAALESSKLKVRVRIPLATERAARREKEGVVFVRKAIFLAAKLGGKLVKPRRIFFVPVAEGIGGRLQPYRCRFESCRGLGG